MSAFDNICTKTTADSKDKKQTNTIFLNIKDSVVIEYSDISSVIDSNSFEHPDLEITSKIKLLNV